MKTIKVGVIGAGQIAYGHCNSINAHEQAEVVAVADPSEKRAKALAKKFGVANVYKSAAELLANKDIDAVSIGVPNVFHAPLAIESLKARKHVLLDKPFAMNADEAKKVGEAARKARKVFTLGMNWRFMADALTMRVMAERGELGDIYHAKTNILRRCGIPKFGTWFCQKKMAGGGAMADIGVHFLDACLYIINNFEPVAVSGATYTKFGHLGIGEGGWGMSDKGKHIFDVDDFCTALIKFKNGATVNLDVSWALHQAEDTRYNIELFGTKAGMSLKPMKLYRFGKKKGEYEAVEPQKVKPPHQYTDRFHNWLDSILGKCKPVCTVAEALAVQKIIDAVYKSSDTGKEIRIK